MTSKFKNRPLNLKQTKLYWRYILKIKQFNTECNNTLTVQTNVTKTILLALVLLYLVRYYLNSYLAIENSRVSFILYI